MFIIVRLVFFVHRIELEILLIFRLSNHQQIEIQVDIRRFNENESPIQKKKIDSTVATVVVKHFIDIHRSFSLLFSITGDQLRCASVMNRI